MKRKSKAKRHTRAKKNDLFVLFYAMASCFALVWTLSLSLRSFGCAVIVVGFFPSSLESCRSFSLSFFPSAPSCVCVCVWIKKEFHLKSSFRCRQCSLWTDAWTWTAGDGNIIWNGIGKGKQLNSISSIASADSHDMCCFFLCFTIFCCSFIIPISSVCAILTLRFWFFFSFRVLCAHACVMRPSLPELFHCGCVESHTRAVSRFCVSALPAHCPVNAAHHIQLRFANILHFHPQFFLFIFFLLCWGGRGWLINILFIFITFCVNMNFIERALKWCMNVNICMFRWCFYRC